MFQRFKKLLVGVAALGALALGASAIAGATTSHGSTSTTSTSSSSNPGRPSFNGPAPGTAAHENAEKAVTGAAADKARAAAVKALGGGTAGAVTTDITGRGYETTVTKSNGSKVEVHLGGNFRVMQGPGGHGGPPVGGMPYGRSPGGAAPPSGYSG
jgi:hypothetical protein